MKLFVFLVLVLFSSCKPVHRQESVSNIKSINSIPKLAKLIKRYNPFQAKVMGRVNADSVLNLHQIESINKLSSKQLDAILKLETEEELRDVLLLTDIEIAGVSFEKLSALGKGKVIAEMGKD